MMGSTICSAYHPVLALPTTAMVGDGHDVHGPLSSCVGVSTSKNKKTKRGAQGKICCSGLVGSLPVDNVQALASKKLGHIPTRYIRPETETETILRDIPTVDLSKLLDQRSSDEESKNLHFACEEWGFFHLVNHGVGVEVIEKMKLDIKEFFKQPLEVKEAYKQLPSSVEGYGQAFVASDEQKLDWADIVYLNTRPIPLRKMRFWPTQPPSFIETLDQYTFELRKVADILFRVMAKNLGVDADVLTNKFEEGVQSVRINYYPPCPQADKALGLSPHTDGIGLTILLQINEVQGLQIKKDDNWIPISPLLPDSFIVNIGDVIEILSNGKYKSTNHRAMVNREKERLSIGTFMSPSFDTDIGPPPELVRDGEAFYKSMTYGQFFSHFLSGQLNGKDHMEAVKLQK
ncbi:S-norcoclaurine synthase 1 [Acorus calamus]|uniref:S-norcoclaurine synthase 1 n=1 Tax=Acorus calamus TaxID=4465 RepID=A0AAV9CAX1_ACOCL|nr:S-norcoclaurine synthase 1 [Acorus calamus]